ncbi:PIN domain-containing protein [Streptomyces sp. 4.24]|uniref:PIN domain-containing protein n=1 Tax=Streptomyces tritrimontium TaxID=3406573 RepID=UPI003BB65FE8
MIVLDTNQLKHAAFPHGAILGMLRKIADLHGRTLALPEMVAIEHVAHYQHEIEQQHTQALRALRALGKAFDTDFSQEVRKHTPADAATARRAALEKVFTVLPTPKGAAKEALRREANRQPPAEQTWSTSNGEVPARGARDVVIWLTVLDAAREGNGPVWLLTQDSDFRGSGADEDFHPALRSEADATLANQAGSLRLLPGGIQQLLGELAEEVTPVPGALEGFLRHPDVVGAVINELIDGPVIQTTVPQVDDVLFHSLGTRLFVDKVARTKAYRVGENTWISAQVRWKITRGYQPLWRSDLPPSDIEFVFDTTLLVQTDGTEVLAAEVAATTAAQEVLYQLPPFNTEDRAMVGYAMKAWAGLTTKSLDLDLDLDRYPPYTPPTPPQPPA